MTTDQFFDAFISYGRADAKAFASRLCQQLADHNLKIWFDQNDIPPAVDWRNQISAGIERAKNLLFIITPYSIESAYCREELETAYNLNKRIIPVLYIRVPRENRPESIRKLNWIFFRDEVDDGDRSFAQLLAALHQDRDYVEQHAQLYVQALRWARNQKQTRYLLVGKERSSAEAWLHTEFTESQAPCLPTDLHCEFISESKKNANNLMSDVFMSYAKKDRAVMEEIRRLLFRQGLTIWTDKTDIKSGTQFQAEINKGIERADTIIYFLSKAAVDSDYCQQELTYARSLNKRIVPLQIEAVEAEFLPVELQGLQHIKLPPLSEVEQFQRPTDLLLVALNQDAYYHQQHKVLLVKALKWREQNENPSILLRGHNLNHFSDWLKQAKINQDYPPVPLQTDFVTASEDLPAESSLDVFISYSRSDSDFVRKLNEALQMQGKTTWFDQESIPSGSDFQQELYRGIQICDNFLFVISPQSVHSPYCQDEVKYVEELSKRIVTVVYQPVPPSDLPESLSKVQWIDFNQHSGEFYANFNELVRTLDIDREYVSNHTKWSLRAMEWENKHKSQDLLLRGSEFALAEEWLQGALAENKNPPPTSLQQEFITKSKKAIATAGEDRTIKLWSVDGTWQRTLTGHTDAIRSVEFTRDSKTILSGSWDRTIMLWNTNGNLLVTIRGHQDRVQDIEVSPDNKMVASASSDTTIKLWQVPDTLLRPFTGHRAGVLDVVLRDRLMASASEDNTIRLWQWNQPQEGLIRTPSQVLRGHKKSVWDVALSPNGKFLASAGVDQTIKLWNTQGKLLTTLTGHGEPIRDVDISPDGKMMASASDDNTVRLWELDQMEGLQVTFKRLFIEHQREVYQIAFSPDSQLLASVSEDRQVIIRHLKQVGQGATETLKLSGHSDAVRSVAFSPDGQFLASAGDDKTIRLWKIQRGKELKATLYKTLEGHERRILDIAFSPDGQLLASASRDDTVKLWRQDGTLVTTLRGHTDSVFGLGFSPDGQFLASGSNDRLIVLWNLDEVTKFENVLTYGCQWIADYLRTNPELSEGDRQLCYDINRP